MTHSETIAAARAVIAERAAQYTPKDECNWLVWVDENGDTETFEPTNCESYCEDCVAQAAKDAAANPEMEKPEGFSEMGWETESCKEDEGFCHCDKCGEAIDCAVIWTRQEIDNWLDPKQSSDEWLRGALSVPAVCWELSQLLDESYGASDKFPAETLEIAERVLAANDGQLGKELAANQAAIDLF